MFAIVSIEKKFTFCTVLAIGFKSQTKNYSEFIFRIFKFHANYPLSVKFKFFSSTKLYEVSFYQVENFFINSYYFLLSFFSSLTV